METAPQDPLRMFGLGLKDVRQHRGMSQDQLAGLSDLYASYVNEIERGKRNPSLRVVLRLLAALDCTLDDVMVAGGKSAVPVRNRAPRT